MSLHVPSIASLRDRTKIRRRYLLPMLIALLGVSAATTAWIRAREERIRQMRATFEAVAETNRQTISRRMQIHFGAVNNLARYWQLYGLQSPDAWRFQTGMVLQSFFAIERIAWVDRDGITYRYLAQDTSEVLDPRFLAQAALHIKAPAPPSVVELENRAYLQVFVPVRTPDDSVGVLAAELDPASLITGRIPTDSQLLAASIRGADGHLVYQLGTRAPQAPISIGLKSVIPLPTGEEWTVVYEPTQAYWATMRSPWPNYFLLTGVLLSIALGAVAFQFMRLREYSSVLAAANRALDAQVRELQARDRELSRINLELESRVAERTAQMEDTVRDLETFSHSVSHDLRSPIGAVLNLVAVIEDDYGPRLDAEGQRLLTRIRTSLQAAVRLLDELTHLTWAGQVAESHKPVEMTSVARAAFGDAVTGDADPERVRFEAEELPPAIGDPTLIARVFTNLFSNALKYTRGRPDRAIHVAGTRGEQENTYTVSDNGVGFDPAQADRLFEPFRRLHPSSQYEGTGLGLAIASKIVRRHGGRIWAESDGVSGARFAFTLPAERNGNHGGTDAARREAATT